MEKTKELAQALLEMLEENIKLKVRINKAIDYIKEELIPYGDDWFWDDFSIKDYVLELLEILGDSENVNK